MGAVFYPKPPEDEAVVKDSEAVAVKDYNGTDVNGSVAMVDDRNLVVSLPADTAVVVDGFVQTIGADTFTFTVAGGVITAIILS